MLGLARLPHRWRNRNLDGDFRQGISAGVTESATQARPPVAAVERRSAHEGGGVTIQAGGGWIAATVGWGPGWSRRPEHE